MNILYNTNGIHQHLTNTMNLAERVSSLKCLKIQENIEMSNSLLLFLSESGFYAVGDRILCLNCEKDVPKNSSVKSNSTLFQDNWNISSILSEHKKCFSTSSKPLAVDISSLYLDDVYKNRQTREATFKGKKYKKNKVKIAVNSGFFISTNQECGKQHLKTFCCDIDVVFKREYLDDAMNFHKSFSPTCQVAGILSSYSDLGGGIKCVICKLHYANILQVDCGHCILCRLCVWGVFRCLVCSEIIRSITNIFY